MTGENRRTRVEACPSAALSTTKPTWTALCDNSGSRGEKPATNRPSYGTLYQKVYWTHAKRRLIGIKTKGDKNLSYEVTICRSQRRK